jgi:hypothetical protein
MLWLGAEGGGFEAPPRILFKSIPIFRRGVGGDTFRSSPIATRPARRRPGSHNRRPPKPNQQKRTQKTSKSTKKTICRSELPSKPHPIEKEKGRRGAGRTVRKTSRNVGRPRVLKFCKPAGPPGSGPSKRTILKWEGEGGRLCVSAKSLPMSRSAGQRAETSEDSWGGGLASEGSSDLWSAG